jgi:DNA-binding NarL/FixJ family response regulator
LARVIRVMLVDDHALLRAGLAQLLLTVEDIEVVAEAVDGADAQAQVVDVQPDVMLIDINMPNVDGIEATRQITRRHPSIKVVALTSFSDRERVVAMLDAGAVGYLLKDADPAEVVRGIRAAVAGGAPLAPQAAAALLRARAAPTPIALLSDRELEVLQHLAQGLPNRAIASRLGITEATVKAHLTRVYLALGVSDRTSAALRAMQLGVVAPGPDSTSLR